MSDWYKKSPNSTANIFITKYGYVEFDATTGYAKVDNPMIAAELDRLGFSKLQTEKQAVKQTETQAETQTEKQAERQADKQAEKQINKQSDTFARGEYRTSKTAINRKI